MTISLFVTCPNCSLKVSTHFAYLKQMVLVKHNHCPPFVAQLISTENACFTLNEVRTMKESPIDDETT